MTIPDPTAGPPAGPVAARPLTGIALMAAAMTLAPFGDAIAKYLSAAIPVLELSWARFALPGLAFGAVVAFRLGPGALWPARPALHLGRGLALYLAATLFFFAIARMPLADALALLFVAPLVTTAVAPFALGERVGARRWAAVAVGFGGALVVLRPGLGVIQPAAPMALAAGVLFGLYLAASRAVARATPALVNIAHTVLTGAVLSSLVLPFVWVAPSAADLVLMAAIGLAAMAANVALVRAFEFAPAATLAPLAYLEIVMATVLGLVWFGDFPDGWTWVGIAVIIGSGVTVSVREGRTPRPSRI